MAQPTVGSIHINKPLSTISIAYMQEDSNFIADRAFPIVPVQHQSDIYYLYNRDAWFRDDATQRAPGTESAGTGWTVSNTTYNCAVDAVHTDINEQQRANADSVFDLDRDGTLLVSKQLQIRKEKKWVTAYFGTGLWTGNGGSDMTGVTSAPGANQFLRWDQAGSTPIEDVQTQIINIAQLTGYRPNKLVISPFVGKALRNNPEILDRVKYVQKAFIRNEQLAEAFGVDEVLEPFAIQNTAQEGAALSMSFIYGKNALLLYAAPNPGLLIPSAGYTFAWTNYVPYLKAGNDGNRLAGSVRIKKFPMWALESDRIEGEMSFTFQQVGSDLGVFFNTAVS